MNMNSLYFDFTLDVIAFFQAWLSLLISFIYYAVGIYFYVLQYFPEDASTLEVSVSFLA